MYEPDLIQTGMIDRTPRAYEYFNREQPRRRPAFSSVCSGEGLAFGQEEFSSEREK
jgi:hypothetical protein